MHWGAAKFFNLLLLLIPIIILIFWKGRKEKKFLENFFISPLPRERLLYLHKWKSILKTLLLILGITLIIVALARPQYGIKPVVVSCKGGDIVLVIDTSASMAAEDIKPNRLEKIKQDLIILLSHINGDRIGMVVFAGEAYIQCPLTLDYSMINTYIDILSTKLVPTPGTNIAQALNVAIGVFDDNKEDRFKSIILYTDGEDHEGKIEEVVKKLKEKQIPVTTIGVGTEVGAPIPIKNEQGEISGYKQDSKGKIVVSRLNTSLLQQIAQQTGGSYYSITDGFKIIGILNSFKQGKKKKFQQIIGNYYIERYKYPLLLAFFCLWLESIINKRKEKVFINEVKKNDMSKKSILITLLSIFVLISWGFSPNPITEGNKLYSNGKYNEALKKYKEAQTHNPKSSLITYNISNTLYKLKEYTQAIQNYQKLLNTTNTKLKQYTLYNIGNSFFKKEQLKEAAEFYKQALALNPDDKEAKYNLELALQLMQRTPTPTPKNSSNSEQKQKSKEKNKEKEKQSNKQKNKEAKQEKQTKTGKTQLSKSNLTKEEAEYLLRLLNEEEKKWQKERFTKEKIELFSPQIDW